MVIIPKPNKPSYDLPKSFQPIVLLNITGKLFEKMLRERLQFLSISNNFVYPCQLGRLKYKSTTNIGVALTHLIRVGWVKNLNTSILAFDITQFSSHLIINFSLSSLPKLDSIAKCQTSSETISSEENPNTCGITFLPLFVM